MANGNGESGTNTVLIVIVLLLIVGAGVWWFTTQRSPKNGVDINVTLPSSNP